MTVKKKRMFSKILCLLLALLMLLGPVSSVVFAFNEESADTGDTQNSYQSNGSYIDLWDRANFQQQGFRIYLAKAYYNAADVLDETLTEIVPTIYGTSCIDLILGTWNESKINTVESCKVRTKCLEDGSNSTRYRKFSELQNLTNDDVNERENIKYAVAAYDRLQGAKIKTFLNGASILPTFTNEKGEEQNISIMEGVISLYWPSDIANQIISDVDESDIPGTKMKYVFFIENTFKIPTNTQGLYFYGTPYEYGLALLQGDKYNISGLATQAAATYCCAIFCNRNKLGADFFPNVGLSEGEPGFRDPHGDYNHKAGYTPLERADGVMYSAKERQYPRLSDPNLDYGVMCWAVTGGEKVAPPDLPEDFNCTEPPSAPESPSTIVTTTAPADASIMTGWESTDGLYDISYGQSSGIPTTEYLTNSIIAQDSILNVQYNAMGMTPKQFPTVSYNLTYRITHGGTAPHGYQHSNDGYDEEPIYDAYGKQIGTNRVEIPCSHPISCYDHGCTETSIVHVQTIPRAAVYYYVEDYAVHALQSVDVTSAIVANHGIPNALNESDVNVVVSGVKNPEKILGTDLLYHVDWSNVKDLVVTNTDIGAGVFGSKAEAQAWAQSHGATDGDNRVGYPKVKNDRFEVDGIVYLDDTEVTGKEHTNSAYVTVTELPEFQLKPSIVKNTTTAQIPYDVENDKYYTNIKAFYDMIAGTNMHPFSYVFDWTSSDSDQSHIMQTGNSVANKLQAMRGDNSIRTDTTLKNGVSKTFVQNDPMMVITPVIASTTVHNPKLTDEQRANMTDEEIHEWETLYGTQMSPNRVTTAEQLRLDESYEITFDPYTFFQWVEGGSSAVYDSFTNKALGYGDSHDTSDNGNEWNGREEYETESKYDKYVLRKYVKFPFDVYIDDILFEENRWICLYEYDPATNTTTAGNTKGNHLETFTFYIPPWADETVGHIEFLVYALNEEGIDLTNDGRGNNRIQSYHGTMNGQETYTFCATNAINVQTSGWAYDFRVVGVNDVNYDETEEDSLFEPGTALAEVSDEFFSGIYNRTGKDGDAYDSVQKRLKNLALVQLQEEKADRTESVYTEQKDTLPMDSPASEKKFGILAGALSQGSEINFTFKTMGNLTTKDKVIIRPTFTYYPIEYFNSYDEKTDTYDESLKVDHEDLLIYYNTPDEVYIRAGSDRDEYRTTYLYAEEFDNTKVKEDVIYTANKLALDPMDFIMEKHEVSNVSWIEIEGDELMLYDTRALAQLERNQGLKESFFVDILGSDFDTSHVSVDAKRKSLTESIQTWYGHYRIPSKMKITTKQRLAEAAITNPETGNVHVPVDLTDYALHAGGITGLEDFWIADDGFLVLNFNICVYKDNGGDKYIPWLLYNDGESNAWELQGQKEKVNIWANSASINKWHNTTDVWNGDTIYEGLFQIDTVPGDIAIINLASDNGDGITTELVFTN